MSARYFEDLAVWKMARDTTGNVYAITREKSFSRYYILVDQMRRDLVSVMSNMPEGFER